MNPYTTMSQARIKPHELEAILRENSSVAGPALAAFERQRAYQAEAELERLLKQNRVTSPAGVPLIARLRQAVGAALIRVGEGLAAAPRSRVSSEPISMPVGTHGGIPAWGRLP